MPPLSPIALVDRFLHRSAPRPAPVLPALPLRGITLLAVEDSRFASDGLRLLCQRSGARLRRVETLAAARAHLGVYRPDVVLVDLGLPDGPGDTLIRALAGQPKVPVLIGISGDAAARPLMLAAGAAEFIEKPLPGLAAFQRLILRHLPDRADRIAATATQTPIMPDRLALRDDLHHAAALISTGPGPDDVRYLVDFVAGLARSSDDPALAAAAQGVTDASGLPHLHRLLLCRIAAADAAFPVRDVH